MMKELTFPLNGGMRRKPMKQNIVRALIFSLSLAFVIPLLTAGTSSKNYSGSTTLILPTSTVLNSSLVQEEDEFQNENCPFECESMGEDVVLEQTQKEKVDSESRGSPGSEARISFSG